MESNYQATCVLTIPRVELYYSINDKTTLIHSAPLHIMYMLNFNSFIMQINDFNYALSTDIPVLASPAKGDEAYPTYVFPYLDGYYVVKIQQVSSTESLSNLETIFSNHCDLAYQQEEVINAVDPADLAELENKTIQLKSGGPKEPVKQAKSDNSSKDEKGDKATKTDIAATIITKGGDLTRTGLIKSAEVISKGIEKLGGFIMKKYVTKSQPKEVAESTLIKLKIANTATSAAYTYTKTQATAIFAVATQIGKQVAKQVSTSDTATKLKSYKHADTIAEIGKSTINAAASIYDGMSEAVMTLARGIGNTTTKIVSHKYGEKVGEATKEGLDAVGNVGKTFGAYKDVAVQVVKENTERKIVIFPNTKANPKGL